MFLPEIEGNYEYYFVIDELFKSNSVVCLQVSDYESASEEMKLIASEAILLLIVDIRQCVKSQKRILNVNAREMVQSQLQMFENYSGEILTALKNWILYLGTL